MINEIKEDYSFFFETTNGITMNAFIVQFDEFIIMLNIKHTQNWKKRNK